MGAPSILPLSPADRALFVAEGPETPQVTALLSFFEQTPELSLLKNAARRGMTYLPRMRGVLQPDRHGLKLVDAVDLDVHVKQVHDPGLTDRDGLLNRVEELHSKPLDPSRPLWEFLLVTNRDPSTGELPDGAEEQVAVLWRIHHGLSDGIRSLGLFQAMLDESFELEPLSDEEREPRSWAETWHGLKGSLRGLKATGRARPIASPFNGPSSGRRRLTPIELDRRALRGAMRQYDASLHDVVLAVMALALQGYCRAHHQEPMDLRVVVPNNQRPRLHSGTGNFVEMLWADLPVSEQDPAVLLQRTSEAMVRAGQEGWSELSQMLPPLIAKLPVGLQRKSFRQASELTNVVCTIMPARLHRLNLGSHSMKHSYAAATLLENHGVGFTFLSQGPKIRGAMITDPAVIPDPDLLVDLLAQSVGKFVAEQ